MDYDKAAEQAMRRSRSIERMDAKVTRCRCGAWMYAGRCATGLRICAVTR